MNLIPHHTAGHVCSALPEQLTQPRGQISAAHRAEVIQREEVQVLRQVTWDRVKLIQHPTERKGEREREEETRREEKSQ